MQTLDNLRMQDKITIEEYLERIPDGYIPKRQELIASRKQAAQQQMMQPEEQSTGGAPVTGAVVDVGQQTPIRGGGGFGEILRCGVVEEFAECFVALGFIDGGVGGAVDDDRHGVLFHEEVHGFSVGDVQFVFVGEEEPDVFVFLRCQFAQFTAQLSVASGDKNGFHIYIV